MAKRKRPPLITIHFTRSRALEGVPTCGFPVCGATQGVVSRDLDQVTCAQCKRGGAHV